MRAGSVVRSVCLVAGLFLFAFAVVLILESQLGLSPWDVLNQGISEHTPLSFGMANVAVGLVVLCVALALGGATGNRDDRERDSRRHVHPAADVDRFDRRRSRTTGSRPGSRCS